MFINVFHHISRVDTPGYWHGLVRPFSCSLAVPFQSGQDQLHSLKHSNPLQSNLDDLLNQGIQSVFVAGHGHSFVTGLVL